MQRNLSVKPKIKRIFAVIEGSFDKGRRSFKIDKMAPLLGLKTVG